MDERLKPVAGTFWSNEGLFRAVLLGVDEAPPDVWIRRIGKSNHMAFLGLHLVGARYFIVRFLGGEAKDPLEKFHQKARKLEDIPVFPGPREVSAAWDAVAPDLSGALRTAPPEFLDDAGGLPFPTAGPSRLEALAFLAQHEAYHIGQMSLLRRIAGLPPAEWPSHQAS